MRAIKTAATYIPGETDESYNKRLKKHRKDTAANVATTALTGGVVGGGLGYGKGKGKTGLVGGALLGAGLGYLNRNKQPERIQSSTSYSDEYTLRKKIKPKDFHQASAHASYHERMLDHHANLANKAKSESERKKHKTLADKHDDHQWHYEHYVQRLP